MRTTLKNKKGKRLKFTGIFSKLGWKATPNGEGAKTILLKDVRMENGELVDNHIWVAYTRAFLHLGILRSGDVIEFYASIVKYEKSQLTYKVGKGWRPMVDYELKNLNRLKIINRHERENYV
jgi:hypothetical protein